MTSPQKNHLFSQVAADYAQYRATYADLAVAQMLAELGPLSQRQCVDIGAGTVIGMSLIHR